MTVRSLPSTSLQQPLPLSAVMANLPPSQPSDDDPKIPFPSRPSSSFSHHLSSLHPQHPHPHPHPQQLPQPQSLPHQQQQQQQQTQQQPQHPQLHHQQPLTHPQQQQHHQQQQQPQRQHHQRHQSQPHLPNLPHHQQHSIPQSSPIPPQYQPVSAPHDLFPDISVPPILPPTQSPGPPHEITRDPPQFSLDPKHPAHHQPFDRKPHDSSLYANLPIAPASSRVTKRPLRTDIHDHSSSPSLQSPSQPHRSALSAQSSLERRKAHRAYTQKSRNKVNSRFEALLDALPTPPPRLNPRSKAEILEYATETVIRLVAQNNKLELHLALSSSPQLESWLTEQTQTARTVREVCQPIMRLFTIGLEWKGAEVWAIDSRAPMATAALGQAWTFVPPPSGRRHSRDDETRIADLSAFLDSAKGSYYTTTSNEALAVVYRTGKPAWFSCEYKASLGFEENPDFQTERTRLAQTYGITDVLFVPLILYNHVQIVVNFYNMRSRTPSENPALQPQLDPKSSIKVAAEAINIIARRFCSLPGVAGVADFVDQQ